MLPERDPAVPAPVVIGEANWSHWSGHRQFESSTVGEAIRISGFACQSFSMRASSAKDKPIRAENDNEQIQGPVIWDFQAHSDTAHALGDVARDRDNKAIILTGSAIISSRSTNLATPIKFRPRCGITSLRTPNLIMNYLDIEARMKTVGGRRRTRYRGLERTQLHAHLVAAAYNLLRIARLSPAPHEARLHHTAARLGKPTAGPATESLTIITITIKMTNQTPASTPC
jgi:hypothetical protein